LEDLGISRKDRIRNVTIRQQIGLEETLEEKLNGKNIEGHERKKPK
jgi:hypothetical protein